MFAGARLRQNYRPQQGGAKWRRYLRQDLATRHLGQQVHNTLHHLEDCSLPYDLWTREAEIAAAVVLLGRYSFTVAMRVYQDIVNRFNASNAGVGIATRPFNTDAASKLFRRVAQAKVSLSPTSADAEIYVHLMMTSVWIDDRDAGEIGAHSAA